MAGQPVILDCDPGTDDAIALMLAIASPELDIRAVTVSGGNVGLARTLANAAALVTLSGGAVPVHGGADRPLLGAFEDAAYVHGADGLAGVTLPKGAPPADGLAADAIRSILRAARETVTLIGIAPVTNLALALATEPALAAKVEQIVLMSGAWGEGNVTPLAEFNAFSDPEALAILLAAERPIVLVPLELTAQALVTTERIAMLQARGGGRALRTACEILAAVPFSPRVGGIGHPLHDPCAVAWMLRPELFGGRASHVGVELSAGASRGRTVIDRVQTTGRPANALVLETLDADGFFDLLGERLASLPRGVI
ncbi:MAG: nucleoside hydrolase [Acetobacteraceae bacterium]|nr:nucleoside hydrolase [Acetobacteraceae bacterium]